MGKQHPYKDKPNPKSEHSTPIFASAKGAKLGTERNPLSLSVQSEERQQEVLAICKEHGWAANVAVDAALEENLVELDSLRNKPASVQVEKLPGRNDPCLCGSGKKYKKCCGKAA